MSEEKIAETGGSQTVRSVRVGPSRRNWPGLQSGLTTCSGGEQSSTSSALPLSHLVSILSGRPPGRSGNQSPIYLL